MKFVKKDGGTSHSIAQRVCERRGTNLDTMLNSGPQFLNSPDLLDNIDEAVELFLKHLNKNSKIYVQVDSDVDGYTSSAILHNYVYLYNKELLKNFYFEIHDGKQHGLFPEKIGEDFSLIIAPDASSNDYDVHEQLSLRGQEVLVLDHHECEKYSENAVVVNNQLSTNYPNKALCGAGVVYQFCRKLDEVLGLSYANEMIDLVAVGLAADMMNVSDPETRFLIDEGLKLENRKSALIQTMADNMMSSEMTSESISFSIAPSINATIRVGDQDLKWRVFKAMLLGHERSLVPSNKRGAFGNQTEELVVQVIRNMTNAKTQQKKQIEKLVSELKDANDMTNKPIVAMIGKDVNPSLVGLVANMLSGEYQCPTIILRENKELFSGSLRSYGFDGFRSHLENYEEVVYAQGHESAAGVAINDLATFKAKLEENFSSYQFEEKMEYDEEWKSSELPPETELLTLARLTKKYGQGFSKPIFKITGLVLDSQNSQLLGSRANVLRITDGENSFIRMFSNKEYLNSILTRPTHGSTTTLYCSIVENVYGDTIKPQFKIESFEHVSDLSAYVF